MRPIDADKIIEYCTNACNGTFESMMFVEFMARIDDMPTLEVENEIIEYLLDMIEEEHIGMRAIAVKEIKSMFGIEY